MTDADWHDGYARSLAVFLNGAAITERGTRGEPVRDEHFLLLFNAHSDAVRFVLPGADHADGWHVVIDTAAVPARRPPAQAAGPAVLPSRAAIRRDRPFSHGAAGRRRPGQPSQHGHDELTQPGHGTGAAPMVYSDHRRNPSIGAGTSTSANGTWL